MEWLILGGWWGRGSGGTSLWLVYSHVMPCAPPQPSLCRTATFVARRSARHALRRCKACLAIPRALACGLPCSSVSRPLRLDSPSRVPFLAPHHHNDHSAANQNARRTPHCCQRRVCSVRVMSPSRRSGGLGVSVRATSHRF